jgi:hypothetical protein
MGSPGLEVVVQKARPPAVGFEQAAGALSQRRPLANYNLSDARIMFIASGLVRCLNYSHAIVKVVLHVGSGIMLEFLISVCAFLHNLKLNLT